MEEGRPIEVQLHLLLTDMGAVNLNEEVYMADFKVTESMNFSKKKVARDEVQSPDISPPDISPLTLPSLTLSDANEVLC